MDIPLHSSTDHESITSQGQVCAKYQSDTRGATCRDLSKEVVTVTLDLYNAIKAKIEKQVTSESESKMKKAFERTVPQLKKMLDKFIKRSTDREGKLSAESFKNFGQQVSTLIYTLTWANYKAISKADKPEDKPDVA